MVKKYLKYFLLILKGFFYKSFDKIYKNEYNDFVSGNT